MELGNQARGYLLKRGYSLGFIEEESPVSVEPGEFVMNDIKCYVKSPSIVFKARSLSGRVSVIHTAGYTVKEYQTFYNPKHIYLPVFYASQGDLDLLWNTGEVVMTEGVFDRIAVKRAFPERAVFARLTKGLSPQLIQMLERVAKRVWFCFDEDTPGERGAEKGAKKLQNVDTVRLHLPTKDPGLLYEKLGVSGVQRVLGRQFNLLGI